MSGFIIAMQVGMWFGYVTFGFISDAVGRKRAYVDLPADRRRADARVHASRGTRRRCCCSGPSWRSSPPGTSRASARSRRRSIRPTIRATAQGFTYNIGRIASAVAPWAVGRLADTSGFGAAFSLSAVAFVCAAVMWLWIPETKGRDLA